MSGDGLWWRSVLAWLLCRLALTGAYFSSVLGIIDAIVEELLITANRAALERSATLDGPLTAQFIRDTAERWGIKMEEATE